MVLSVTFLIFIIPLSLIADQSHKKTALSFVENSCLECHDEDVHKGDLRLDTLYSLKEQPKQKYLWLKIYDQVASGKMPPPKKAFSKAQREEFLATLGRELSDHDRHQKNTSGRVVYRRLNSTEYEYSVRDLLHLPDLNVKKYLPMDSQYHGITNVADRQQIAYNQIAQYLEAAEMSLHAALALTPKPEVRTRSFRPNQLGASRKAFNNAYKIVGDKLVLIKEPELSQGPWGLFTSPKEPGRYKIRFKAHSAQVKESMFKNTSKQVDASHLLLGKKKQSVSLGIALGRYFETFDLSPESNEFTCEVWLHGSERLAIHCEDLPLRITQFETGRKPEIWDAVALEHFEIEGPLYSEWPPKGHKALFADLPSKRWNKNTGLLKPRPTYTGTGEKRGLTSNNYYIHSQNPDEDSYKLLKNFMTKALRRPVQADEVIVYQDKVKKALDKKICFQDAMLIAYKAILSSPDFLYLHEKPGTLSAHELATRLSLYLWRSLPDQQLSAIADSGELTQPDVLNREIQRMLNHPKANRFIDDFSTQWLNLESIYATTPDKSLYPEYHEDSLLVESLVKETKLFVREMVHQNLPISNIVNSNFTFLNERLAKHYNIPNVKGSQIRKVSLAKDSIRGGIITQGSMMKITANGFTTSPILRGIWLIERILGTPPPPPPPNAGAIEPDIRGAKTIRELLNKHREVESCASCHQQIDPPGFALECFDILGGFRTQYRSIKQGKRQTLHKGDFRYNIRLGQKVDSTGIYKGQEFSNIHDFKEVLLNKQRLIAKNILERLLTQATGATPTFSDRAYLERILNKTKAKGYPITTLITELIQTPMFLEK